MTEQSILKNEVLSISKKKGLSEDRTALFSIGLKREMSNCVVRGKGLSPDRWVFVQIIAPHTFRSVAAF
jgi:hypothetical protein